MIQFSFEVVIIFMNIKKMIKNRKFINSIRILLCVVLIFLALTLLYDIRNVSLEDILSHGPKSHLGAALFVFVLYAIKSVTVFIPLVALQLIVGAMFDPFPALIVNFVGIIICYTIPYYIGKRIDDKHSENLLNKFPKLEKFIRQDPKGVFIPSLFLRCIGFLPTDLVSAYLGTFSTSYFKYITGSLLGSALRIAAVTILGTSLNEPTSPQFIISVIIVAVLTVISVVGYVFYQKKKEM